MKKAVIGIVDNEAQAERIVNEVQRSSNFVTDDVSVLMPDRGSARDFAHVHNTKAPEGAATGAGAGALLGGTLGVLAGIGALAIPGLGPLIAAGPVLAALSGAGGGAMVGGLAGALVGMGIPEIEARAYEGRLRGGDILVAIHVDSSEEQREARNLLRSAGARDVDTTSESSLPREARTPR